MTITDEIRSLPRAERRKAYLAARRADKSVRWEPFRRWDGGKPNILSSVDLLRIETERKRAEKEAAATGRPMPAALRVAGLIGAMSHGLSRKRRRSR